MASKISINKKDLERLAELSRINLDILNCEKKEELSRGIMGKLLVDIQSILNYFEELKEVDAKNIEPMAGGTIEVNVFRENKQIVNNKQRNESELKEAFPEKEGDFLKVPTVFE